MHFFLTRIRVVLIAVMALGEAVLYTCLVAAARQISDPMGDPPLDGMLNIAAESTPDLPARAQTADAFVGPRATARPITGDTRPLASYAAH